MDVNTAYRAFKRANYARTNRLINRICWLGLLTGPLIALFIFLGINQRLTTYTPCLLGFLICLLISAVHTLLMRSRPDSKLTAYSGIVCIQIVVITLWMVSINVNLTWFFAPICSLLFCDKKLFAFAAVISYFTMLPACWLDRFARSAALADPDPIKWYSTLMSGNTIEFGFLLLVSYAVCRLLQDQLQRLYGAELTINRQKQENNTDALTGLYTRRFFVECLDTMPAEQKLGGSLMVIDLDNFKQINDSFGHLEGDRALKLFAQYLQGLNATIPGAMSARFGGDEFLLFIPDIYEDNALHRRLNKGKQEVAALFADDPHLHGISFSLGAVLIEENRSFDDLFSQADGALLKLKQRGKNGYLVA